MFAYYSFNTVLSLMALIVLCILVRENDRLNPKDKRLLYLTYALIMASALAEWLGLFLDGRPGVPSGLLKVAKCADYILTPMAGVTLVSQMRLHSRWYKALLGLLAFNAVFQLVSLFGGWTVVIDANGHYTHGPLYGIYVLIYLVAIAFIGVEFTLYGKHFRRENRLSLYTILALILMGIVIQEGSSGECRTVYVSLAFGAALMYIHFTEFSQLATDDYVMNQRLQLLTDPLTGLQSRYAYTHDLDAIDARGYLPVNLAIFMIDINGLKAVNDTTGHDAGDELIRAAADCIQRSFGSESSCYRIGGDEFVVLAEINRDQAKAALEHLQEEAAAWKGTHEMTLSFSAGFAHAREYPALDCRQLIQQADRNMYDAKAAYYRESGRDRRRR